MKQQKYYQFLQKQIVLMIGLALIPGLVYVFFGWIFEILVPALLWYAFLIIVSLYGFYVYEIFDKQKMDEDSSNVGILIFANYFMRHL